TRASNVTAGGIYNAVIKRERRGDYLGGTVQVVPHITDEIKHRIRLIAETNDVDVVITEIGGTVGDIESLPFLEAIRQFPVDVGNIYKGPLWYAHEGVDDLIVDHFGMEAAPPDLREWESICEKADAASQPVKIALVGKYVALEDAYLSVVEALRHSGFMHGCKIDIEWVDSETLESDDQAFDRLDSADGILVPGGFGGRGIEGKIRAARV